MAGKIGVIGNPSHVVHEGYLIKSPPENKMRDWMRWKKRYFRLWSDKRLHYYKDEKSKEAIKEGIDLNQCTCLESNLMFRNRKNVFSIATRSRKYFFVPKTAEEMNGWLAKFASFCNVAVDADQTGGAASSAVYPGSQVHLKAQSSPNQMKKLSPAPFQRDRSLPSVLDAPGPAAPYDMVPPPRKVSTQDPRLQSRPVSIEKQRPASQLSSSSRATSGLDYDIVPAPRPASSRMSTSSSSSSQSQSPGSTRLSDVVVQPLAVSLEEQFPKRDSYVDMTNDEMTIYDRVPRPRPAHPDGRSEEDEQDLSYVDMQAPAGSESFVVPPPVPEQTYSEYDFIPKVRAPADGSDENKNYDTPQSLLCQPNTPSVFTQSFDSSMSLNEQAVPPPSVNRSAKPNAPRVNRGLKPGSVSDDLESPIYVNNRNTVNNDYGDPGDFPEDVFGDGGVNNDVSPSQSFPDWSQDSPGLSGGQPRTPTTPTTPTSPPNDRKKALHYADVKFATVQKNKKSFRFDDETPYSAIDKDLTAAIHLAMKEQVKDQGKDHF